MSRPDTRPGPLRRWLRFLGLAWFARPAEVRSRRQPAPFKATRD